MRHIISLLLENEPGALSRVVGLFSQRNYNIESLTVAPTEDPTLSRLTLTTVGHDEVIEQITKNLNKLIEVVKRSWRVPATNWTASSRPSAPRRSWKWSAVASPASPVATRL